MAAMAVLSGLLSAVLTTAIAWTSLLDREDVRLRGAAETLARPGISFSTSTGDATQSGSFVPHTIRNSATAPVGMGASPRSGAASSGASGGPPTVAGDRREELRAGDVGHPEGTNGSVTVDEALESTHAGAKDEEIIIADDLAEEVSDEPADLKTLLAEEEEHTDAGAAGPPFRQGH